MLRVKIFDNFIQSKNLREKYLVNQSIELFVIVWTTNSIVSSDKILVVWSSWRNTSKNCHAIVYYLDSSKIFAKKFTIISIFDIIYFGKWYKTSYEYNFFCTLRPCTVLITSKWIWQVDFWLCSIKCCEYIESTVLPICMWIEVAYFSCAIR